MSKKRSASKNGRPRKIECGNTITLTQDEIMHLLDLLTIERCDTSRWMLDEDHPGMRTEHAAELLDNTRLAGRLSSTLWGTPEGEIRRSRTA